MEETLMDANASKAPKIKTHHARIVVDGTAEKPYYSIEWYDPTKNEYYLGYSSYNIENVLGWLKECFEIVEKPKTNADRIRAMTDEELADWNNFCPHIDGECTMEGCTKCILEWLKQPVEE